MYVTWVHDLTLFHEKTIYTKWRSNTKETERPKNEANKFSLLVNMFDRELMYRNVVLGHSRMFRSLHLSPPRPFAFLPWPLRDGPMC